MVTPPEYSLHLTTQSLHLPQVGTWLKETSQNAGIDSSLFKARSVRAASTSAAANLGFSTNNILQAANWSSDSHFLVLLLQTNSQFSFHKSCCQLQTTPLICKTETFSTIYRIRMAKTIKVVECHSALYEEGDVKHISMVPSTYAWSIDMLFTAHFQKGLSENKWLFLIW